MKEEIINRVARSSIETIDIKVFRGTDKLVLFDIKNYLHDGYVLREKNFRKAISSWDFNLYINKSIYLNIYINISIYNYIYLYIYL